VPAPGTASVHGSIADRLTVLTFLADWRSHEHSADELPDCGSVRLCQQLRDDDGVIRPSHDALSAELTDLLYYILGLTTFFWVFLSERDIFIAVPENDDFVGERKKTSEPGAKGA
jgi:hypothetical protein